MAHKGMDTKTGAEHHEGAGFALGPLPDTLQLRSLLLDLYTEQVAGYYDPDSATFMCLPFSLWMMFRP